MQDYDIKKDTQMDLTSMSVIELKSLQINIKNELILRTEGLLSVEMIDDMSFCIKFPNIEDKQKELEDIFTRYGPGNCASFHGRCDIINFYYEDKRDALDCHTNLSEVKRRLVKVLLK